MDGSYYVFSHLFQKDLFSYSLSCILFNNVSAQIVETNKYMAPEVLRQ